MITYLYYTVVLIFLASNFTVSKMLALSSHFYTWKIKWDLMTDE